jgi:sulfhydrogenase subunit beta (sulfur reductase)
MALVLEKKQISDFIKELKEKFEVFDCRQATLPPKRFFLPAREEIFRYYSVIPAQAGIQAKELDSRVKPENDTEGPENDTIINAPAAKEFIVFGLDPADLEAMTQLDEIMEKPQPDFFYFQKREKAIIVGLAEESIEAAPGGDVILEKINPEQYQVRYLTEKGKKITSRFFKELKELDSPLPPAGGAGMTKERKLTKLQKMLNDPELLADAVVWSINHKIWDDLAGKCLGCAICAYVCPLCYCFSLEDRVRLDDKECSRCRYWDACVLPDFSKIAGGYSFRKTLKQRYYNWFYHKFVRAYQEYGKAQCVGCGRCQKQCPAGIDIEKVLERILKDYKKKK